MSARGFSRDCAARNLTNNWTVDVALARASAKRADRPWSDNHDRGMCTVLSWWPAGSVPMMGSLFGMYEPTCLLASPAFLNRPFRRPRPTQQPEQFQRHIGQGTAGAVPSTRRTLARMDGAGYSGLNPPAFPG